MTGSVCFRPVPVPATALGLRLGVVYAPRDASAVDPFPGVELVESGSAYVLFGYSADGRRVELYSGGLGESYLQFARHLRMVVEVEPNDFNRPVFRNIQSRIDDDGFVAEDETNETNESGRSAAEE